MPFFSFVLNKDYNSSQLDSNINERIILQKYTRYYCKNTTIWRNLKSKKYNYLVDNISYEKRKKINHQNKNIIFCLPPSIGLGDAIEYGLGIKSIIRSAVDLMGIEIIPSPPADPIVKIRKVLENSKTPVFDIDVDYFTVMHDECFTPRTRNGKPMDLGNLDRILKLIRKVQPPLITMSEAKMKALNNPNSKTSFLLDSLKNMGYEREDFILVEDDEYAQHLCDLPYEFEKGYHEYFKKLELSILNKKFIFL